MAKQIKSKERVAEHGEVFTNEREVNAMLDLVKPETERIDSRFLETACGEGAFLRPVLKRKLDVVKTNYKKSPLDYEKYSLIALMSLYGVDLLEDNVQICRNNLYKIWDEEYTKTTKSEATDRVRKVAQFILKKNILCGDALSLIQSNGEPIIFVEWSFVSGNMIKRRDFRLDELLKAEENNFQASLFDELFSDGSTRTMNWELDEETGIYMPGPIKDDYPLTEYRRIDDYE